jgi:acyl-CoA synthetase (NDP forming)
MADLARTAAEAASIAGVMGYPVVAKLAAKDALHKSDVGGVKVNLRNQEDVRAAFAALMAGAAARRLTAEGIWIQPMIAGGTETMIGIVQDRLFGALVGFGRGGTDVEVLDDVHFRVAPLSDRDADELIAGTRAFTLMSGYRGRPPGDLPTLTDLLLRVSRLADTVPEILELDLNPVIVLPAGEGCQIVDARIRVGEPARPKA